MDLNPLAPLQGLAVDKIEPLAPPKRLGSMGVGGFMTGIDCALLLSLPIFSKVTPCNKQF